MYNQINNQNNQTNNKLTQIWPGAGSWNENDPEKKRRGTKSFLHLS